MAGNLTFTKKGDIYEAQRSVSASFALHLESDEVGEFKVLQKSDPGATRASLTAVFPVRAELDEQFQNIGLEVLIIVQSTVPVTYGSIIEVG